MLILFRVTAGIVQVSAEAFVCLYQTKPLLSLYKTQTPNIFISNTLRYGFVLYSNYDRSLKYYFTLKRKIYHTDFQVFLFLHL